MTTNVGAAGPQWHTIASGTATGTMSYLKSGTNFTVTTPAGGVLSESWNNIQKIRATRTYAGNQYTEEITSAVASWSAANEGFWKVEYYY